MPAPKNAYRVPAKQWRKWSAHAKAVFNSVYGVMRSSANLFLHPKADEPTPSHWRTTAWNAAWTAAEAADGRL